MDLKINDNISLKEKEKHGMLRGHVEVYRTNTKTGEKSLWYDGDNTITISGSQFILMKIFDLFLDSDHVLPYQDLGRDTNLVMDDLNSPSSMGIGKDPSEYTTMTSNISENHYIQGFMVGNGGAAEDAITTKNTDYSYVTLRNAIPFQQTTTQLAPSLAGKYTGNLKNGNNGFSNNYYIKKFDERPHIYHSWYAEGQSWDHVDPVTIDDLGPNGNAIAKTNRIETYVECDMSVDTLNGDCLSYFQHDGVNDTALINELGLVAFDAEFGNRSIVEGLYQNQIRDIIRLIFDNDRAEDANTKLKALANEIKTVCDNLEPSSLRSYGQSNINAFLTIIDEIDATAESAITDDSYRHYQDALSLDTNIEVEAAYNQNGKYLYATDKFMQYLSAPEFTTLTNDEAQRIRLVTYYTFRSIPLDQNWKIDIKYRIYAN